MTTLRTLGPLQWAIILLAAATALIHIALAFTFPGGVDPIFILNGLGYLGLVALLFLPVAAVAPYRNIVRWVLIAYTATTIIIWLFPQIGARSPVAYITKAIEVALIVCLWLDGRRAQPARAR
jgi:hypothetical protein